MRNAPALDGGTVLVIDEGGALRASARADDRRVAGVVSGAGDFRPGIILDAREADVEHQARVVDGKGVLQG